MQLRSLTDTLRSGMLLYTLPIHCTWLYDCEKFIMNNPSLKYPRAFRTCGFHAIILWIVGFKSRRIQYQNWCSSEDSKDVFTVNLQCMTVAFTKTNSAPIRVYILTQLLADMNVCKTSIDWPLYLTLTLTHVIDNSHDFVRPSWDVRGAVIAIEAVATFHRAEGVNSIEDPDPVAITVSHQRTARIPTAGLQGGNSIDFHF